MGFEPVVQVCSKLFKTVQIDKKRPPKGGLSDLKGIISFLFTLG